MFDIENWLPFLLAKSHQVSYNLMKSAIEPYGLTPPQFATLAFLWKKDGLNQQEIGHLMNIDRTTIGGIIDRLGKLGLVRRGTDPSDRRSHVIYVTSKGKAVQDEIIMSLVKVQTAFNERLTPHEQDQLKSLLQKIRQI